MAERRLLTGWGRTAPSAAEVIPVRSDDDVATALKAPPPRGVLARGLARAYGDAAQNAGGEVLDMVGLDRVHSLDLERGVTVVDAGVSLDDLLRTIVPLGWFIAVSPGTRYVTVGGAIAANVHGKNHHGDGSFCRHVLAFQLRLAGGEVRTVTPDGDPEVFWATAGGLGLTGVVTSATLQLLPVETAWMKVDTERTRDLDDCMARMEAGDDGYRYSVAWVDCLARGATMGRSVLTRGDHARLDDLESEARPGARRYSPRSLVTAPPWVPTRALNRLSVAAFNELWYRRAPEHRVGGIESIATFFHPLDMVREWSRVYGRRGFLQYQLEVPFGAERAVQTAVERVSSRRCPSFLAVLKRFGALEDDYLSFPRPGWTLTLDIPVAMTGLDELLDGLDEVVLDAGGRLYLAKDSRLAARHVPTMYPRLDAWREVRDRLDPDRHLSSDLA
ncbi:MAG: FAD-binding oxidoreductase [Acidimicrobiales bacterium]